MKPAIIIEDLNPENMRKGEKGTTFMIKLKLPYQTDKEKEEEGQGFGEGHIIGPNHRDELFINSAFQVGKQEYILNVRLLNYELQTHLDNKFLKPGTEFHMFCSTNGR